MKKLFVMFAVVSGVVLAACNNKPAEEAVEATTETVEAAVETVDSAATAVVDSAAAAATPVVEEVKK